MASAKAKAKGKAKAKASAQQRELPNGYKVLARAPNWDPDANPVISGFRNEETDVTFDKGTADERTRRCCTVNDRVLGPVTVWESSYLKEFFDKTGDGDDVMIEFTGYGEAKPGQDAPKIFTVGVKPRNGKNPF